MTRWLLAGALIAGLSSTAAHAQPGATEPLPPPPPAAAPTEPRLAESTALAASLGGTVASWALIIAAGSVDSSDAAEGLGTIGALGTFIAPSFGHWYAGTYFTRGMGLRALGGGAVLLGGMFALGCGFGGGCDDDDDTLVWALLIGGAGLYAGGTVDDIVQAPRRARRVNAQRGYAVVPRVTGDSVGLALGGTF